MKQKLTTTSCLILLSFLLCATSVFAQTIEVSGKVTDNKGLPLQGASVHSLVNGKLVGMVTDVDGHYLLKGIPQNANINFSFIGYVSQKFPVNGRTTINVVLEEDAMQIGDVVVTGYQTTKKTEYAGAVAKVVGADVMQASKFSVDQMLAGQVAGMTVIQTNGEPSATPKIRIRGTSSIAGSKAPIWVLDGVVLEDPISIDYTDLNGDDAAYLVGNAIAGVNPQDIEDLYVLKDAAATAIYGVRAANGVIVVTTKRGKKGKPQVRYSGNVSLSQRTSYDDVYLMNAAERIQLSQDIIDGGFIYSRKPINLGYEGMYMDYQNKVTNFETFQSEVNKAINRNTDWYKLLFRDAVSHSHSVSLSGGDDRTTYYASLGYANNQGTAKTSSSEKYTVLAKIDSWIGKKFNVKFNLNGYMTKSKGFHTSVNPNSYAYTTSRVLPAYNDDGSYFFYVVKEANRATAEGEAESSIKEPITRNMLYELEHTGANGKVSSVTASLNATYKIWDGLRYELAGSFVSNQTKQIYWQDEKSYNVGLFRGYNYGSAASGSDWEQSSRLPYGGIYQRTDNNQQTWDLQNKIGYSKTFNRDHVVSVLAISELKSVKTDGFGGKYYGWMPDRGNAIAPLWTDAYVNFIGGDGYVQPEIANNRKNYVSWIGTGSYSYKNKYIFNANVRMDGSNQFGTNPKYRFLPIWSVAGKWIASNESFFKNNILTYFALRASYGLQGNVDAATSPDLVTTVGVLNATTSMFESYVAYLPNPNLRWEKTKALNLGFDFVLLKGRVNGTFDYYDKRTTDLIMNKTISATNGIGAQKINAGSLYNRGFEIDVTGYPIKTKDWELEVGLLYSYNKNRLTRADETLTITVDNKIGGSAVIVGDALGTLYSYDFAGLSSENGLPLFYDQNGNKTYTLADGTEVQNYTVYKDEVNLVKSGVITPPSTGSIRLGLRYKNWRLKANLGYSFGGVGRLPALYADGEYSNVYDPTVNITKELVNRWKQAGDELHTNIPGLYDSYTYDNLAKREYVSGRTLQNGVSLYDYSTARICKTDNLRLNSLTLSYYLDEKIVKQLGISALQVNLQATNLFLITNSRWHGYDPESSGSKTTIPKTYSLGVNISF